MGIGTDAAVLFLSCPRGFLSSVERSLERGVIGERPENCSMMFTWVLVIS